ncbi:hypothetical protein BX666DRAFT_1854564 [Dichotomocladium elegans]|nr:hypothetical protein BX666DRAFT_1854564 [Dichotomocladium elegans]
MPASAPAAAEANVILAPQYSTPKTYPYTIVTASSANHLCALESFLYSLNDLRPEVREFPRIVVYNIGMNRTQLPVLDQLLSHGYMDELITFDYFKYPRFWDVAINAGEYAWKTGIVHEAAEKYPDQVLLWLDAGDLVTADFLIHAPDMVRKHGGFWSPRSSTRMSRWTHPGMFAYFNEDPAIYAHYRNCNGAAVGFDLANSTARAIVDAWYQCGLDKNCIAPPGSSRLNHRQDQAVLTYLAYKNKFECTFNPSRFYNLQIHRDVACAANLLEREVQNMLHHPSAIDYPKWERADTLQLYNHPEWRYPADKVPDHIANFMNPVSL